MRYISILPLVLLLAAPTARADWQEASSDHFVIYGEQGEESLRRFAERLELFHAAMAHVFNKKEAKPSPSNRLTVYVVSSRSKVQELSGMDNRFLAGVYLPRAGAAIAVVPTLNRGSSKYELSGEKVLYHEYAHHFMSSLTARKYPRWFTEGFAEFFAGVKFMSDGNIGIGLPPMHRAAELAYAREVPIRTMLEFDGGAASARNRRYDAFYGQSWVLFHYLHMAPERAGQVAKYEYLLGTGDTALEAAEGAFGDLDQLEKEMESYQRRSKVGIRVLDRSALVIGPIAVRRMRPGESAIMPIRIESKAGVTTEEALALLPDARKVAAAHPEDPMVLAALAEAEFDAGNDDAAIAAADRALAIDPAQIDAHIQKGYALFSKVKKGALPKEALKDVRLQFVKANKVENDHPAPLVHFYLAYLEQGQRPTQNAINGLEWAMRLAPFDPSLRWLVAQQMVADARYAEAVVTLAPLAYSPHPGENTERARALLEDVESRIAGDQGTTSGTAIEN